MRRAHHREQMLHHHISAFYSSSHHTSPSTETVQSPQQAALGGKVRDKLPVRHTSAHSSLVFAHTVEIFDEIAWSCKCIEESC